MKHCENAANLIIGDEILYHNKRCVVLDIFDDGHKIKRYTVYSPKMGVYTVFSNEIEKHLGHLPEADALCNALTLPLEKTA